MPKDPVCDVQIDPDSAVRRGLATVHAGTTYYFCSKHCKREFESYPAIYIGRADERDHPLAPEAGPGDQPAA